MTTEPPRAADALRPSERVALDAWARRVRAYREQIDRVREDAEPADFYAPLARRFAMDPQRQDDPSLDALLALVRAEDTCLDIGAGGGRYALPLALATSSVEAIDPSAAMLDQLRAGMRDADVSNISITQARWPVADPSPPTADVVLMAHVGYTIEDIGDFLGAAERSARRTCVAIMRTGPRANARARFWSRVHGDEPVSLPALPELLVVLLASGRLPDMRIVDGRLPGAASMDELLATSRRLLHLRAGSAKDRVLTDLVQATAIEQNGFWSLDDRPALVGVVSWQPR